MSESEKQQVRRKLPGRVELVYWVTSAIVVLAMLGANGAAVVDCAVFVVGIAVFLLARCYSPVVWLCVVAAACAGVCLRLATWYWYGDNRAEAEISLNWALLLFWALPIGVAVGFIACRIAGLDHRWFQFRLRTLLIGVVAWSVLLSSYFAVTRQARRQREAIAAIRASGGSVIYEWQRTENGHSNEYEPKPTWIRAVLGDDYFDRVVEVSFGESLDDDDCLEPLEVLPDLEVLSLSETHITGSGLRYLGDRPALQTLYLSNSQISDASLAHVKKFRNLQKLDLARTKVTDAGLAHLAGLGSLQWLGLNDTLVTDSGMKHLETLTSLRLLDLYGTRITDAGLEHLKGLPNLRGVELRETAVTEEGVTLLKKSLHVVPSGW